jgi:hypothetical protein
LSFSFFLVFVSVHILRQSATDRLKSGTSKVRFSSFVLCLKQNSDPNIRYWNGLSVPAEWWDCCSGRTTWCALIARTAEGNSRSCSHSGRTSGSHTSCCACEVDGWFFPSPDLCCRCGDRQWRSVRSRRATISLVWWSDILDAHSGEAMCGCVSGLCSAGHWQMKVLGSFETSDPFM